MPEAFYKSFTSLFYFGNILQGKTKYILSAMSHFGRNMSNLTEFSRLNLENALDL